MPGSLTSLSPPVAALATPLPRVLRPQRAVPSDAIRPTRAEVNLAALRHNLRVVQRLTGRPVWSVLKADGYGHGAKAVARTLERAGSQGICVALLEEALELRAAGIRLPLLVMGGYFGNAWGEVLRHGLTPVIHDPGQIEDLAGEIRYAGADPVGVHVKVDTGMGRLGVMPRALADIGRLLTRHPEVRFDGLMTHFACADAGDPASLEAQMDRFDEATAALAALGLRPTVRHAANSAALMQSERAYLDLVRPGVALFGVEPRPGLCPELRPVMTVRTQVVSLRELAPGQSVGYGGSWTASRSSVIATIPMGYADGLSRLLSNRGSVLVRGKRAPLVGNVSMDLTTVDVTEVPGVKLGDEVVVLGPQRGPLGEDRLTASEIAERMQTIPWEVLTSISRRVPRFYREP
jgi:alanine racemase